ncbi:MAG: chromosomal replication initiator protein DnaA [Clostridia bacterium]|nr:chromosomal replication initiator protein DnaA [Clostridia bacterium]
MSVQIIWPKALQLLKPQMTDASYDNWIRSLIPLRIEEDNTFVLQTESAVYRDTLERFYASTIEKSLRDAGGAEFTVRFTTKAEEAAREQAANIRESCPTLIPKYTFDTFVRGESNRFAYAAAHAVAENPSTAYNPLFIYGGVGLGKTHLMHAIGHYVHEEHPEFKILYISSENFTNDVVASIEKKDRASLREKYRSLDVLLIDDIQFIGGKDATELEFFNVFNDLRNAGKQIIITSDKPPKDVPVLEARLRTRFGWGLVVDIQPPDYETRLAILRRKAMEDGIDISDEVLGMIAERVNSNIRDLEGCLNRVVAYARFINKPVTVSIAESVLKDYVGGGTRRNVTGDLIKQVVCDFYGISTSEMESTRRDRRFAYPRQIAMHLSRTLLDSSYQEIGMIYGNRHYSTVMHACEQIEAAVKTDPELKKTIEDLTEKIKNG